MKKLLLSLVLIAGFAQTVLATQTYNLDPHHSYVEYHIAHMGFSNQTGKWFVNGQLALDKKNIQNSSVNVTIPVNNVVTGIPELDKHLQTADFFDTAKYPTATFKSTKVTAVANNKFNVEGNLTLHGITKPVTLIVTQNKTGIHPMFKTEVIGFSAVTTIKRTDFGINAYLPMLGNEIKLNIEAEADLPNKK